MADIEKDRVLAGELGGLNRLAPRPAMLLGNDHLEGLFVEKLGRHTRRLKRHGDDRGVYASALERCFELLGQVLLDLERHLRRALVERRNEIGQQVRRDRVDDTEPEQSHELVSPRLRDLADMCGFLEDLLRLLDNALADGRNRDLRLAALEELRAELFLELLDRDR